MYRGPEDTIQAAIRITEGVTQPVRQKDGGKHPLKRPLASAGFAQAKSLILAALREQQERICRDGE